MGGHKGGVAVNGDSPEVHGVLGIGNVVVEIVWDVAGDEGNMERCEAVSVIVQVQSVVLPRACCRSAVNSCD